MEINNFKLLERELMENREPQIERVKNSIEHSRSLFQSIGDFVELFFPKVIEVFIKMSGGQSDLPKQESRYPHEN